MSAPERPDLPDLPDPDLLGRVLDGLRSLPEQARRRPDDDPSPATDGPSVPLPRRR